MSSTFDRGPICMSHHNLIDLTKHNIHCCLNMPHIVSAILWASSRQNLRSPPDLISETGIIETHVSGWVVGHG